MYLLRLVVQYHCREKAGNGQVEDVQRFHRPQQTLFEGQLPSLEDRHGNWTSIIAAYSAHGDAEIVLSLFDEMLKSGTKPDPITFTFVLSASAHSGLIDKAWDVFNLLSRYEIQPLVNHYACMVVCMSRAGNLSEAVEFVKKMPFEPTAQVWGALLSGAAEYGDVELAEFVCDYFFELGPENASNYVVMANLYSNASRWEEAERVREKLNKSGFKKAAGSSRVEIFKD